MTDFNPLSRLQWQGCPLNEPVINKGRTPLTAPCKGKLFENLPDLMTVDDLALAIDKSPGTIRNWIARREIPFVRIGNRSMVLKASFLAWLEEKENKPCR